MNKQQSEHYLKATEISGTVELKWLKIYHLTFKPLETMAYISKT